MEIITLAIDYALNFRCRVAPDCNTMGSLAMLATHEHGCLLHARLKSSVSAEALAKTREEAFDKKLAKAKLEMFKLKGALEASRAQDTKRQAAQSHASGSKRPADSMEASKPPTAIRRSSRHSTGGSGTQARELAGSNAATKRRIVVAHTFERSASASASNGGRSGRRSS